MCSTETLELEPSRGKRQIETNGMAFYKQLEDTSIVMISNPKLISDNLYAAKTNHTYGVWLP